MLPPAERSRSVLDGPATDGARDGAGEHLCAQLRQIRPAHADAERLDTLGPGELIDGDGQNDAGNQNGEGGDRAREPARDKEERDAQRCAIFRPPVGEPGRINGRPHPRVTKLS